MAFVDKTAGTFTDAGQVINKSFWSVARDPQILLYPILAFIATAIVGSFLGASFFADWYNRLVGEVSGVVPNKTHIVLGIVGFTAFYTAVISAYFMCAVSASVLSKLEGNPTKPFSGLYQVGKHFFRVSRFALLAVFMFPVGILTQLNKLPRKIIDVLGSSLGLSMAQLAPEILNTKKGFGTTVVDAVEILGKKWKVSLVLKIGIYSAFGLVVVLPKLIQAGFFSSPSADKIGWAISLILGASTYSFFKVINSIFMSVLYYKASQEKK